MSCCSVRPATSCVALRRQANWEKNNTFKETVRLSEGRPEFTFYDGPPFATGLPHYGHILAGESEMLCEMLLGCIIAHVGVLFILFSLCRRRAESARAWVSTKSEK